jgi:hypothetical protein
MLKCFVVIGQECLVEIGKQTKVRVASFSIHLMVFRVVKAVFMQTILFLFLKVLDSGVKTMAIIRILKLFCVDMPISTISYCSMDGKHAHGRPMVDMVIKEMVMEE